MEIRIDSQILAGNTAIPSDVATETKIIIETYFAFIKPYNSVGIHYIFETRFNSFAYDCRRTVREGLKVIAEKIGRVCEHVNVNHFDFTTTNTTV